MEWEWFRGRSANRTVGGTGGTAEIGIGPVGLIGRIGLIESKTVFVGVGASVEGMAVPFGWMRGGRGSVCFERWTREHADC